MGVRTRRTRGSARRAAGRSRRSLEGAAEDADWSLRRARESIEHQILCPALSVGSHVLFESGRTADAALLVDELVEILRDGAGVSPSWWFVQLAIVLRGLARAEEVAALVDGLDLETRWARAAAMLARGEEVTAADELAEIGSLPHEAWARLESGGPNQVEQALVFYRSVGATRYAALADARLAESRSA